MGAPCVTGMWEITVITLVTNRNAASSTTAQIKDSFWAWGKGSRWRFNLEAFGVGVIIPRTLRADGINPERISPPRQHC